MQDYFTEIVGVRSRRSSALPRTCMIASQGRLRAPYSLFWRAALLIIATDLRYSPRVQKEQLPDHRSGTIQAEVCMENSRFLLLRGFRTEVAKLALESAA